MKKKIEDFIYSLENSKGENFKDLNALNHLNIKNDLVTISLELEGLTDEFKTKIQRGIAKFVKIDLGITGLKISFDELVIKKDSKIKFIAIASGKGGVGKSTVTSNIAYTLNKLGKKTAIIDADIYGCSIPKIFDIEHTSARGNADNTIIPFNNYGVELISASFFTEENKPIMWRGPMLAKMLNHFFKDMDWNKDTEYIIIDLPPGTGDVALDINKLIPTAKMLLVTTANINASQVAVKAGVAAKSLNHDIIGVIENMSYFVNPVNDNKELIFGEGGGLLVSRELNTDLIAQIPINQPSTHHSLYTPSEPIGLEYLAIANKIIKSYA